MMKIPILTRGRFDKRRPERHHGGVFSTMMFAMSFDTRAHNSAMTHFDQHDSFWLFGYGSLIWKADFAFIERRPAYIEGWARRFWQGSHDHRGTPELPGRVATLTRQPDALCYGMAYRIEPAVLAGLDLREKNGYLRERVIIRFDGGRGEEGLIYLATEDNAAFLGAAPLKEMAAHIARAHGPSGSNREYLLNLASALAAQGVHDEHVSALAALLPAEGEY
ncbi:MULTISPECIES: gamma-glutamylcyclotransferase [Oceanimonas]|uniref:glutathione-specific gamma-glutamylcyclotransferase n=1 Tax=Oceanimonas smirnovii TaxID=264574 RepID=A0ABW7P0E7_9GAMM|nr:gamma-glutamylcyclotransferase [Oceanimonas sp. CAM02]MDV2858803.1 gamma-glutamylcyclotransferase [Oceanimonas sp. CAM02]